MPIKKLTTLALFTTIALIIFTIESAIPPMIPIPGIKLGLSNIITLVLLRNYSLKDTFCVVIAKILLSTFFFGQALSLLYSLAGGICCVLVMYLINKLLQNHFVYLTGSIGAVSHNMAQLLVAYLITTVPGVLAYLPHLVISGIFTGLFTGLCAHFIQRYLMSVIAAQSSFPKSDGDN